MYIFLLKTYLYIIAMHYVCVIAKFVEFNLIWIGYNLYEYNPLILSLSMMEFPTFESWGRGPIYKKVFPLKVKIGLDLDFGLWPRFWVFQSDFTLDYFDFYLFDFDFDLEVSRAWAEHWLGIRLELWPDANLRVVFWRLNFESMQA